MSGLSEVTGMKLMKNVKALDKYYNINYNTDIKYIVKKGY